VRRSSATHTTASQHDESLEALEKRVEEEARALRQRAGSGGNLRARRAFARAGFAEDAVVEAKQGVVVLMMFGGDAP
jgi:hypothetical protein